MKLFDSHAHLASERFEADLSDVLARMRESGVAGCMVMCDPGDDEPDHVRALEIARANKGFYLAAGVHPHNARNWSPERERTVRQLLAEDVCTCLGEIGLDYHYDLSPRDAQREAFEAQLDMAVELGMPVQMHIREAHGDAQEILRARWKAGRMPDGIMHCYSGSWEMAKVYLSMGLYISLCGVVTFKNANKLLDVARNTPRDRLLIETDCPYMAPVPMRGQRNEPAFVRHTFERVAELRGEAPEALAETLWQNAHRANACPASPAQSPASQKLGDS